MAEFLLSACRLALFGIAFLGLGVYLCRKLHVAWQFVPILAISCISLLMYAAGLLNFMPWMAAGIVIFGIYEVFRQARALLREKPALSEWTRDPGRWYPVLFCAVGVIYILYYTRGGRYPDGDTMTHWGVIVREMCELHRMPNFSSREIIYQSYPPGTACFLYFVCTVVGYYESMTMTAQALIVLSCLLAPFGLVKGRTRGAQYIVLTLFAVYALQFNVTLDDLKVDNILPLITLAAVCLTLFYWKEPRKALWLNMPVLCFLVLIKNSSPIYCLFVAALLFCTVRAAKPVGKLRRTFWGCAVAAPAFTLFVWHCHTQLVFVNASATRHSTSVSEMLKIFESRTPEDIRVICSNFFTRWFHPVPVIMPNGSGEWPALLVLALLVFAALRTRKYRPALVAKACGGVLAGYVLYKFCLLGMYLFNLPDEDALYVGAYERYTASIAILLYGLAAVFAAHLLAKHTPEAPRRCALWAAALCCCMLIQPLLFPVALNRYLRPDYLEDGLYRQLCVLQREYDLPKKDGYILAFSHAPYAVFFIEYAFRSANAKYIEPEELDKILKEEPEKYNWLIIADHDDKIDTVLELNSLPLDEKVIVLNEPEEEDEQLTETNEDARKEAA